MRPEIKASLDNYEKTGYPVGGFLTAVLENRLQAVCLADDDNLRDIVEIFQYVYNNFNPDCWGDKKKVHDWIEKHSIERERALVG